MLEDLSVFDGFLILFILFLHVVLIEGWRNRDRGCQGVISLGSFLCALVRSYRSFSLDLEMFGSNFARAQSRD